MLICEVNNLDDYLLELNEVDYSHPIIKKKVAELFNPNQIYARPHPQTVAVLEEHMNAIEMYKNHLPECL